MKNVMLICALVAVAVMTVGLFLYEYVPSGLTVSKANTYEVTAETTEVLNDASTAQELLSEQSSSTSSQSGSSGTVQTNIVLKEYNISKTDLAMYQASGEYEKGRADPFAEIKDEAQDNSSNGDSNNNSNSSNNSGSSSTTSSGGSTSTTQSDGTFYNSSKVK